MLEQVLAYLRNYFIDSGASYNWRIKDGAINVPFLKDGQYFRIIGSVLNDGVYQYPASDLVDEEFDGYVMGLAIPKALLNIVAEIEEWQKTNGKAASAPYQSESFGGYSYTLKNGENGSAATWQSAFSERLNIWRKI